MRIIRAFILHTLWGSGRDETVLEHDQDLRIRSHGLGIQRSADALTAQPAELLALEWCLAAWRKLASMVSQGARP